jgi:protein phosphatase
MEIAEIPASALVVLVGAAGAGKSTFARNHFSSSEILSSDFFRGLVCDDEGNQDATPEAFQLLNTVLIMRLRRGRRCVIDATNVRAENRRRYVEIARQHQRPAIAIVFNTPPSTAIERAAQRKKRPVDAKVVLAQLADFEQGRAGLESEGFHQIIHVNPADC